MSIQIWVDLHKQVFLLINTLLGLVFKSAVLIILLKYTFFGQNVDIFSTKWAHASVLLRIPLKPSCYSVCYSACYTTDGLADYLKIPDIRCTDGLEVQVAHPYFRVYRVFQKEWQL